MENSQADIREVMTELKHLIDAVNENKKAIATLTTELNIVKSLQDKAFGGLFFLKVIGGFAVATFSTISWWIFGNIIFVGSAQVKQETQIEYIKQELIAQKKILEAIRAEHNIFKKCEK